MENNCFSHSACSCLFFTSKGIQIRLGMRSNQICLWRSPESSVLSSTSHSRRGPGASYFVRYYFNLLFKKDWLEKNLHDSFLLVSQIQNLGYFPVKDLQLNIEIPEMTKNGNQLLQISDFFIDQVSLQDLKWEYITFKRYRHILLIIKHWIYKRQTGFCWI